MNAKQVGVGKSVLHHPLTTLLLGLGLIFLAVLGLASAGPNQGTSVAGHHATQKAIFATCPGGCGRKGSLLRHRALEIAACRSGCSRKGSLLRHKAIEIASCPGGCTRKNAVLRNSGLEIASCPGGCGGKGPSVAGGYTNETLFSGLRHLSGFEIAACPGGCARSGAKPA